MRRTAFAGAAAAVSAACYYDEDTRRNLLIATAGGVSRAFVRGLNNLNLHDAHNFHAALNRHVLRCAHTICGAPCEFCAECTLLLCCEQAKGCWASYGLESQSYL